MPIAIFNEQDVRLDETQIKRVYDATLAYLTLQDCFDTELTLCDEQTIRAVNADARGVDAVTDVLSFPAQEIVFPFVRDDYDEINPETGNLILGELLLCVRRAEEQAREYGHTFERECAYLTVHGLLHLFGYDHMRQDERERMRAAEETILGKLGIARE